MEPTTQAAATEAAEKVLTLVRPDLDAHAGLLVAGAEWLAVALLWLALGTVALVALRGLLRFANAGLPSLAGLRRRLSAVVAALRGKSG